MYRKEKRWGGLVVERILALIFQLREFSLWTNTGTWVRKSRELIVFVNGITLFQ